MRAVVMYFFAETCILAGLLLLLAWGLLALDALRGKR
jgi:hypothetical protein